MYRWVALLSAMVCDQSYLLVCSLRSDFHTDQRADVNHRAILDEHVKESTIVVAPIDRGAGHGRPFASALPIFHELQARIV